MGFRYMKFVSQVKIGTLNLNFIKFIKKTVAGFNNLELYNPDVQ